MQISNIDVSLSKGKLLNRGQLILPCICIACCCICILITLIMAFIPQIEWDVSLAVTLGLVDVISVSLLSVMLFILVKNNKLVNNIKLWLQDAVELEAYSKKIGEVRSGMFSSLSTKIQVRFSVDGKVYKRESSAKITGIPQGYTSWFNKYADREVKILYSPKYEEVLILKDSDTKSAMEE